MIASLVGVLLHVGKDSAVVEVAGVGYQVLISSRHMAVLPGIGSEVRVFTHLLVREDALVLVAFPSAEERELFLMLHGVSGVGAKTALGVLSALTVPQVVAAVVGQEPRRLAQAPGVGKKTAERIILELREKLDVWRPSELGNASLDSQSAHRTSTDEGPRQEALLALLALGYGENEASDALEKISAGESMENTLRMALAQLSRF
ncbi:MAG: Holliday junction branch migration protein RuvA [Candidatus Sericytochromatia bacterium]|nr:Holliday junction branch migration protein RuvA [Candidatus Sericytochromatia bacterium]